MYRYVWDSFTFAGVCRGAHMYLRVAASPFSIEGNVGLILLQRNSLSKLHLWRARFHCGERRREIYSKYKLGLLCVCELSQPVQEEI